MKGTIHIGNNPVLQANGQELELQSGTSLKAKMHGKWYRGRYEEILTGDNVEAVLNAGDKKFRIPEGTEIELV